MKFDKLEEAAEKIREAVKLLEELCEDQYEESDALTNRQKNGAAGARVQGNITVLENACEALEDTERELKNVR